MAVLNPERMGKIVFGASLDSIENLLGANVGDQIIDHSCSMVKFNAYPGTYFMVIEGVVTRADAAADVPNFLGIKIGNSLEKILKKHPQTQVSPHKYIMKGYYLTFPSKDTKAAMVIEVGEEGTVLEIRAGLQPSVGYVEHCS